MCICERAKSSNTSRSFRASIRLHSDFVSIQRMIEGNLAAARLRSPPAEPWQVFKPLASTPDKIDFSADEMSMLLGLKDLEVFNSVLTIDVIHNSKIDLQIVLSRNRAELIVKPEAEQIDGELFSGTFTHEQMLRLRPKMVDVNSLFMGAQQSAERDVEESRHAMTNRSDLLRRKLGLEYRLEEAGPKTATAAGSTAPKRNAEGYGFLSG